MRKSSPTTTVHCVVVHLEGLHAHHSPQLFEDHKLESGGRCESGPDGEESTPESGGTLLSGDLNHTVNSVVVNPGVSRLVHQSCTNHVEGSDCAGHEKTSSDGRHELRKKGLLRQTRQGHDVSFGLIVNTHLGTVEDHGASDVGVNTTVETAHALLGKQLAGRLADRRRFPAGSHHHSCLQHVEGVCKEMREETVLVTITHHKEYKHQRHG